MKRLGDANLTPSLLALTLLLDLLHRCADVCRNLHSHSTGRSQVRAYVFSGTKDMGTRDRGVQRLESIYKRVKIIYTIVYL